MGLQVKIQERQFGLFFLPRSWTPLGRAVFEERGRALLWLHPAAPPVSSLVSSSVAIPTLRVGMDVRPALGDRPAQLLYFFLQGGCSNQGPLMASLILARSSQWKCPSSPLLWVLLLGGWTSARPGSSILCSGLPPFYPRQSFSEDTISAASSSICSTHHSGDPGSLLSLYTS